MELIYILRWMLKRIMGVVKAQLVQLDKHIPCTMASLEATEQPLHHNAVVMDGYAGSTGH